MQLGDLIARFGDEAEAEEAILALSDLALLAQLRRRAEADGLALGAYAAAAVNHYAAVASDEEWITLMGALGRARDPGAIFLSRALAHAVAPPDDALARPAGATVQ
jgi:hypothetical protein